DGAAARAVGVVSAARPLEPAARGAARAVRGDLLAGRPRRAVRADRTQRVQPVRAAAAAALPMSGELVSLDSGRLAVTHQGGPGFYGKLPSRGDFVSRRLPADFIGQWDAWL